MIIFIPNGHGVGHYFRLLNIANRLKSYTNEKIGFYINDMEYNHNVLSKVNYEKVIWITDLQYDLSGRYKKYLPLFRPFK